jgi:hypothetical protein
MMQPKWPSESSLILGEKAGSHSEAMENHRFRMFQCFLAEKGTKGSGPQSCKEGQGLSSHYICMLCPKTHDEGYPYGIDYVTTQLNSADSTRSSLQMWLCGHRCHLVIIIGCSCTRNISRKCISHIKNWKMFLVVSPLLY